MNQDASFYEKVEKGALSTAEENWAKSQKNAIRYSKSAEWYSWVLIALSCSGAFWTHFLGFLEPVLDLDVFSIRILRFLSLF